MPAPNASSRPRPEPTYRWSPCQLQKLRLSNRWKTKSPLPRSASPKGWGCQLEDKHYFSYQIPATWMTNNVVHSNLPQSASENFSLNFVPNQKAFPEDQSKYVSKETQTHKAGSSPAQLPPALPRPWRSLTLCSPCCRTMFSGFRSRWMILFS